MEAEPPGARLRRVGVRLEGLIDVGDSHHQLAIDERAQGWREAEQAVDQAAARFGAKKAPGARAAPGGELRPLPAKFGAAARAGGARELLLAACYSGQCQVKGVFSAE